MAQENEDVESQSQTLDHSHSPSSSSDPSLSRNSSFSKLNAQAPSFVPARPQQQQQQPPPPPPPPRLTVVPPPPPPAMMHIYPQLPHSPFHVPIHSPVPVSHVIPVQNQLPHQAHHHNHHQHHHHHHNQNQQYVPVRNHNNNHHHQGQNSHYVPVQYHGNQQHQNHYGPGSKKGQSEEELEAPAKKDVASSSDHASKSDKNGLSDEAMQKLLHQVEYYFSDLNLATTDHLMRFINKDPEGYVPISVVASFKKIKVAIHSISQLASILRNSSKLVVSEDGKKVRRQHPLTESDVEELQTRIIVAENLPEDHCHQNLMKIFSAVGSVKTIRTCPPQTSGGGSSSASRSAKVDGMHFSNKLHAFVEYESIEIAEKAVAELNDEENWRSGLKVRLMLKQRTSKPTQGRGKKGHDAQGHSEEEEVSTSEQQPNEKQIEDCSQQHDNHHSHEHSGEDHTNDKEGAQRKGRNRGRGKGRGRGQYHHNHHNNRGNHGVNPSSNNGIIGEQPPMSKQPPGPRMPDGTRGFAVGRGKPVAVNIT